MRSTLVNGAVEHVYLHVPFCARRCSYCDFSIAVRRVVPVNAYVNAIASEVRIRHVAQQAVPLKSLYLGGGTPSLLGASGVAHLFDVLRDAFVIAPGAEVTLEANPEDITEHAVAAWREAGVNRLSIGVQSFDDRVLSWMHRVHTADSARRAVRVARDGGLAAFSLDLIFALPASLGRDWARDVDEVLSLEPDHVSLYGLTVESHTPLGRWRARGTVVEAGEDAYEQDFLLAHSRLRDAGFDHYEVSNFGRPGRRAVHNSAYWSGAAYLGLGPSAHGFDGTVRRWNVAPYAEWSALVGEERDPEGGAETLTDDNRAAESVYLGLRTRDGLAVLDQERPTVARWLSAGWVEWVDSASESSVRCTPDGWLRLDALAADLTALRSHS